MRIRPLVLELLEAHGPQTVDDLMRRVPGFARQQILAALQNARFLGEVDSERGGWRTRGEGKGQKPATYTLRSSRSVRPSARRVASVWELANL